MHGDAITVAYLHGNEVAQSFTTSFMTMLGYDNASEGRVARGGWLGIRCSGGANIPEARNFGTEQFLRTDSDWLLWIDSDMGFQPDLADRLFETAHPIERPIVGALCFAQQAPEPDGYGGWDNFMQPTIYTWDRDPERDQVGFRPIAKYPINTVMQVAATGSAAILIHRSVLETIAKEFGPVWYERLINPSTKKLMGEDLSFCATATKAHFPIHVHTGVRTTHYKGTWLNEMDYWRRMTPEPATEPTAVIVPVMGRPDAAQPFMDTLRASSGLVTAYAVADFGDDDTIHAWRKAGATVIRYQRPDLNTAGGTFAQKVNHGFNKTAEPWVFIVGDDVRFRPAWLDHAQMVGGRNGVHVVGTNDLGNPRVMAGEHGTHLLIRRSYVRDHGASWDGPGILAHEGYRHWFVDDEIVTAAKQRNAWGMALGSIVEHLHPAFKKGDMDAVYQLGISSSEDDQRLFEERFKNAMG